MLPTPEPKMLADYRAELLAVGLPEHVADAVVIDAAAAVHHRSGAHHATPVPEVDDLADLAERAAVHAAHEAERTAQLEAVAS